MRFFFACLAIFSLASPALAAPQADARLYGWRAALAFSFDRLAIPRLHTTPPGISYGVLKTQSPNWQIAYVEGLTRGFAAIDSLNAFRSNPPCPARPAQSLLVQFDQLAARGWISGRQGLPGLVFNSCRLAHY